MAKGNRKARVEEEEEEEGTYGIGGLWDTDLTGTQEHSNSRHPHRNGYDEWGGPQTDAYPTAQAAVHHSDSWGTHGGKGNENPYPGWGPQATGAQKPAANHSDLWGVHPSGGKGAENPYPGWGPQAKGTQKPAANHPDSWGIHPSGGKGAENSYPGWGPQATGAQKPAATNDWPWPATTGGNPNANDHWGASGGGRGPAETGYDWGPSGGGAKAPMDAGWPADGMNKATGDSWPGGFMTQAEQQRHTRPDRRKGRGESDWGVGGNQFDDLWDNPDAARGRSSHKNNQNNMYEPSRLDAGDPWGPAPQMDPVNSIDEWSTTYHGDFKNNATGNKHDILNALKALHGPGGNQPYGRPLQEQEKAKSSGKKNRKNKKSQPDQALWPMEEEPMEMYDNPSKDLEQAPWSTTIGTSWGGDSYSLPSKAFALASDGRQAVSSLGPKGTSQLQTHFISSRGEALLDAEKALFSPARLARNRLHWTFSPTKDERVSSLLEWIELMKQGIATFGLNHFLQTRERGALISNADYRPYDSPNEPAFDWISYDEATRTKDRILQESLAYYDPTTQILVFVFLLSKTGNSMAIWRRKLPIPNNLRLSFGREIAQTISGLRKQYPIYLDEDPSNAPLTIPITPEVPKKLSKKKWLRWGTKS